jgi:hypothetical protein
MGYDTLANAVTPVTTVRGYWPCDDAHELAAGANRLCRQRRRGPRPHTRDRPQLHL